MATETKTLTDAEILASPPAACRPGPSQYNEEIEKPVEKEKAPDANSTRLADVLKSVGDRLATDSQSSATLLADPLVRQYLTLRNAGKTVKLVTEGEKEESQKSVLEVEDPIPENIETMTGAQQAAWMVEQTRKMLKNHAVSLRESLLPEVESKVSRLRDEVKSHLDPVVASVSRTESDTFKKEFQEVKDRHGDFDQMKPVMIELNKRVEGLTLEELYTLAKLRSGTPPLTQSEIETERPSTIPGNRESRAKSGSFKGRSGFARLLDQSLGASEG